MFKFILVFLLINCNYGKYLYQTKFLSVPVDHFSFANNASFKLRYLINDTYWDSNGPIFFYTGNEGNITVFAENSGFIWEIADTFGALIVFAEHRYYGESMPFGNKSLINNSYLGYLSSSQALADYVYLIDYLQSNKNYADYSIRNPVVAFGGSYGGMLAAWIRMKYPAFVLGAIASSAPIYQFQGLTPCETYNDILTSVYNVSSNNNCPYIIKKSWPALRQVLSSPNGTEWLISTWKLCRPIQSKESIDTLIIDWLTNVYSNLAMANYPYPANFLAPLPAYPVKEFCRKLKLENINNITLLLTDLGNALQVYSNFTGKSECLNINSSTSDIGEDVWDYQACTEMVMPMCSGKFGMFEEERWNFTKYSADCEKRFGVPPIRPDLAILEYGGKDIKSASNIVFSNGLMDPWSGGGVLQDVSPNVRAILIPDGAHHLDLRSYNELDPKSVISARKFHQQAIRHWLKTYKTENLELNSVNIQNNYA
ncbi:lysosomal Pro-X carboxypeptidase [Agrilus planipennis]|uniref:Lysosomal Pro-X carboxypeptidase n=1 Tax=Agrilus planipennis TaxID=224129 RepID=A0A1W4X0U7_AGRPL|nr:lysosomal Pro-X carboxypeptidase [Agrilus planipennis]